MTSDKTTDSTSENNSFVKRKETCEPENSETIDWDQFGDVIAKLDAERVANGDVYINEPHDEEVTTPTQAIPVNGNRSFTSAHLADGVAPLVAPPTLVRTFRMIETFKDPDKLHEWFSDLWKSCQGDLTPEEKQAFHGAYLAKLTKLEGVQP
jgi:hypothetical protein